MSSQNFANLFLENTVGQNIGNDGSVTLEIKLDKDNFQCCICYEPLTSSIFSCRNPIGKSHNVCGGCEWHLRRMKSSNGHTKSQRCPMCKISGGFVRNEMLERTVQEFCTPCQHSDKGCLHQSCVWEEQSMETHLKEDCLYDSCVCPVCSETIEGVHNFVDHIANNKCSVSFGELYEDVGQCARMGLKKSRAIVKSKQNSYFYNEIENYVILFVWKNDLYFDVAMISLDGADIRDRNEQCQVEFVNKNDYDRAMEIISQPLNFMNHTHTPSTTILNFNVSTLRKTPSSDITWTQFFFGHEEFPVEFYTNFFSLSEILCIGCSVDCRDYFGKWYEAEILDFRNQDSFGRSFEKGITHGCYRIFAHYLGYSSNYDEWFDLKTDMGRVAISGTHSRGPDLRTVRRNDLHQSSIDVYLHTQNPPQQHPQHSQQHLQNSGSSSNFPGRRSSRYNQSHTHQQLVQQQIYQQHLQRDFFRPQHQQQNHQQQQQSGFQRATV